MAAAAAGSEKEQGRRRRPSFYVATAPAAFLRAASVVYFSRASSGFDPGLPGRERQTAPFPAAGGEGREAAFAGRLEGRKRKKKKHRRGACYAQGKGGEAGPSCGRLTKGFAGCGSAGARKRLLWGGSGLRKLAAPGLHT